MLSCKANFSLLAVEGVGLTALSDRFFSGSTVQDTFCLNFSLQRLFQKAYVQACKLANNVGWAVDAHVHHVYTYAQSGTLL